VSCGRRAVWNALATAQKSVATTSDRVVLTGVAHDRGEVVGSKDSAGDKCPAVMLQASRLPTTIVVMPRCHRAPTPGAANRRAVVYPVVSGVPGSLVGVQLDQPWS